MSIKSAAATGRINRTKGLNEYLGLVMTPSVGETHQQHQHFIFHWLRVVLTCWICAGDGGLKRIKPVPVRGPGPADWNQQSLLGVKPIKPLSCLICQYDTSEHGIINNLHSERMWSVLCCHKHVLGFMHGL